MTCVTSYIPLDISGNAKTYSTITSKQGDRSTRYIEATIVDGKKPYTFKGNETIKFNIKRADNTKCSFDGNIKVSKELSDDEDNAHKEYGISPFLIPSWALEVPGRDVCDIVISSNNTKITTPVFYIQVIATANLDVAVAQ